jgi:hypothetical protein
MAPHGAWLWRMVSQPWSHMKSFSLPPPAGAPPPPNTPALEVTQALEVLQETPRVEPSAILPHQPSARDTLHLEEGLLPEPEVPSPAYADPPCRCIPSTYPPASTLMESNLNSSLDTEPLASGPAPTRPVCPSPTAADSSEGSSPPSHIDAYNPTARVLPYNGSLDGMDTPPCQPLDSNPPTADHPNGSSDTPDPL